MDAVRDEVDSVMIASEPFTVAYGLDQLTDTLVIDIGAGTTDLCRMHGTMPGEDDQLTINFAGDYIDRLFGKLVRKSHPEAGFSENMATQAKEKFADVSANAAKAVVKWPVNGKPTDIDVSKEMKEGRPRDRAADRRGAAQADRRLRPRSSRPCCAATCCSAAAAARSRVSATRSPSTWTSTSAADA